MNRPTSIDQAALTEALTGMGIHIPTEGPLLRRVAFDDSSAELTYEALGADGQPVVVDGAFATVTHVVPITAPR
jgi:hypothetical protein